MIQERPQAPNACRGRKRRPWWLRALVVLALAYVGWCAVLYFMQDSLIFPRSMAGPGDGKLPQRRDFERVWIDAPDGVRVEGWFFRAFGASKSKPAPCLVQFHGNGDLIDYQTGYADFFTSHGLNVLLVEYRGYARSGGQSTPPGNAAGAPSESAIVEDSLRFVQWLEGRADVDAGRLVYLGHSLGTAVAAQLAARRKPAAMILEAPFTSVAAFASGYGAPPFLVRSPFRTDEVLPPLAAAGLPVLLGASRQDEIVPFSHAARLKELMPAAKLVEIDASHNSMFLSQPVFEGAVLEFLRKARVTRE